MIQDLEQIEYRLGMLEKGMKPEHLPVKVWRGAEIPADVRAAGHHSELPSGGYPPKAGPEGQAKMEHQTAETVLRS